MHALARYYRSTLGKKFAMAVTGGILFAFVLLHMLGNLQVFLGREQLNSYARLLRVEPAVLWAARLILLTCVGVHILAAVQLTAHDWTMRPVGYAKRRYRAASYSARTMVWSGPIVGAFVIYHLLHFTVGTLHPDFTPGDVYHNVVTGFSVWYVSAFYVFAQVLLGLHLYHGLWSLFQTVGATHASHDSLRRAFASAMAYLVVVGNCSIPLAVLLGLVR
jgi:succinate dehydrogenase / fumarate reductase, cytochrome b subunit